MSRCRSTTRCPTGPVCMHCRLISGPTATRSARRRSRRHRQPRRSVQPRRWAMPFDGSGRPSLLESRPAARGKRGHGGRRPGKPAWSPGCYGSLVEGVDSLSYPPLLFWTFGFDAGRALSSEKGEVATGVAARCAVAREDCPGGVRVNEYGSRRVDWLTAMVLGDTRLRYYALRRRSVA